MGGSRRLTTVVEREDDGCVALYPEVDVASQGATIAEARSNVQEAVELFFATASPQEINERCHAEVYITQVDILIGQAQAAGRGSRFLNLDRAEAALAPVGQKRLVVVGLHICGRSRSTQYGADWRRQRPPHRNRPQYLPIPLQSGEKRVEVGAQRTVAFGAPPTFWRLQT